MTLGKYFTCMTISRRLLKPAGSSSIRASMPARFSPGMTPVNTVGSWHAISATAISMNRAGSSSSLWTSSSIWNPIG
jgi:hypothetical protein